MIGELDDDETARRGAFDDLLEPAPKRRPSTQGERELMARAVALALEALGDGATPGPRPRTCNRCEAQADIARRRGELVVPPREATSWLYQGRRYYAATCVPCTDIEWSAIWQRRYDLADEKKREGEMRRLTAIAEERDRLLRPLGRRVHIRQPGQPGAEHATYGAR